MNAMTSPLRTTSSNTVTIAVCGNPNTGKTTIFNAITGLSQQVGNYPGVTVEKVSGYFTVDSYEGVRYNLVDIPGAYSLAAISPDEHIAASALYGKVSGSKLPDAIICVLDATNLERSLYLLLQILQIGQPVVLALNMVDLAERRAISIDTKELSELLGGIPVVPVVGNRSQGMEQLKEEVAAILDRPFCPIVPRYDTAVEVLLARLFKRQEVAHVSRAELIRVLFD
ncbi:MAG: 50S ribosome-binding GTPase, partial [candidate division Zixibacteria bacterium]|nr:50S ribosome-binding GTPase [candidate division Zixibacteria bacterium]